MDTPNETTFACPGCKRAVVPLAAGREAAECPDCGFLGYDWEWRGEVAPVLREAAEALKSRIREAASPIERIALMNDANIPLNVRLLATIEYGKENG